MHEHSNEEAIKVADLIQMIPAICRNICILDSSYEPSYTTTSAPQTLHVQSQSQGKDNTYEAAATVPTSTPRTP
mgnify:CR=1 FL=1